MLDRQTIFLEGRIERFATSFEGSRVWLGIEFDTIGAELGGPFNRCGLRIDEHAHSNAAVPEARDDVGKCILGCIRRPPCLAGNLTGPNGHQRTLVRPHFVDELDEIGPRVALDIVLDLMPHWREHFGDFKNVGAPNVPLICTRMHRDPGGARLDTSTHGFDDARHRAAPGIPEGRDLVDVDA